MIVLWSVLNIFLFVSDIKSGDVSELCSGEVPIDGAFGWNNIAFLFKGSKVWQMNDSNIDRIDGPKPIGDVFKEIGVNSVEAAFHITTGSADSSTATRRMQFMVFLFKGQEYYIYEAESGMKYHPYTITQGVPFGLSTGKGPISSFNLGNNRPIDAIVFNRKRFEAIFIIESDVYIVSSFERWSPSPAKVTKEKTLKVLGTDKHINAALDISDTHFMLISGQKYCVVKWSDLKCDLQSIQSFFKCKPTTNISNKTSEPKPIEAPKTTPEITSGMTSKTSLETTTHQKDNEDDMTHEEVSKGKTELLIIVTIGVLIVIVVLILSVLLFIFVFTGQPNEKTESKAGISTFSGAFGPKSKNK